MNSQRIDCVAIVGVGLIGGSFGMALRKRSLARRIIGIGRSPERLQRAVELNAIDSWSTDLPSAVLNADMVYISTPVGLELDFIREVAAHAKSGCVITDAGSTKGEICRGADSLVREGIHFVGAHPMAGSEITGVEAADPDLFVNATYVLTPSERTHHEALTLVHELAEAIGSRVIVMDPDTHDRCAAAISHLPHLIAAALVALAREQSLSDPQVFDLIAGSFRDMTRVAGSSAVLWRDICLTNVKSISDAGRSFHRLLDEGLRLVESGDGEGFAEWFAETKRLRDSLIPNKDADKTA